MNSTVCRILFSLCLGLGSLTAASALAAPPCAAAIGSGGVLADYSAPLEDADRAALASSIFKALHDPNGRAAWPVPQISAAPACEIATFEADDATWTVSGGSGDTPPRWARAPGRADYLFLAVAPATGAQPTYFLVGASGEDFFVFRSYLGAPDDDALLDGMKSLIGGQLRPLAIFDITGDAVSLAVPTVSGVQAQLFGGPTQAANLYGPDGHFFGDADDGGNQMRGSGFICRKALGAQQRSRLIVVNQRDEKLDLGCGFSAGQSWTTVFVTRVADAVPLQTVFEQRLRDAIRSTEATGPSEVQPLNMDFGQIWTDPRGLGQGLWMARRGRYVIEARATFAPSDRPQAEAAVRDIARDVHTQIAETIR